MKLHIIRHGDPNYDIDSLTEKGWREAELLSDRVVKMNIDDFYASPLGRAQHTAKPALEKLNKTFEVLPWLHEYWGRVVSPFTGNERNAWDFPPSVWANDERYYDINKWTEPELMKNGSSLPEQVVKEIYEGLDALLAKYGYEREGRSYIEKRANDATIACFCHFGVGSVMLGHLIGLPPMAAIHNLFLPPTSVTTLVTETDKDGIAHFRCTQMGDTSHLYVGNEPVSESGLYPNFYL